MLRDVVLFFWTHGVVLAAKQVTIQTRSGVVAWAAVVSRAEAEGGRGRLPAARSRTVGARSRAQRADGRVAHPGRQRVARAAVSTVAVRPGVGPVTRTWPHRCK